MRHITHNWRGAVLSRAWPSLNPKFKNQKNNNSRTKSGKRQASLSQGSRENRGRLKTREYSKVRTYFRIGKGSVRTTAGELSEITLLVEPWQQRVRKGCSPVERSISIGLSAFSSNQGHATDDPWSERVSRIEIPASKRMCDEIRSLERATQPEATACGQQWSQVHGSDLNKRSCCPSLHADRGSTISGYVVGVVSIRE